MKKRSIQILGHNTSVTLEDEFWTALKEIAKCEGTSTPKLIARIDAERTAPNLSSAIRIYVLNWYQK